MARSGFQMPEVFGEVGVGRKDLEDVLRRNNTLPW